jgi:hypothetical protein
MTWRTLGGVCGLLLCLGVLAHAEHTPLLAWMRGYTGVEGLACCDRLDCLPAVVTLVAMEGDTVTVQVNGVVFALPQQAVHRSQDGRAYWCVRGDRNVVPSAAHTRCVFWADGV